MKAFRWAKGAARLMGIDQAVAFTLAGNLWNVVTAPLLLVLVVSRVDVAERGLLFNFISICQVQLIFALGVGTVIQQLTSRERAFLSFQPDGTLEGDPYAKARLAALFRIGLLWFFGLAFVAHLILLPAGWWFFETSPGTESISWQIAWGLTITVAVADAAVNNLSLFLSGCGQVTEVARLTAAKQVVMTTALMLGLFWGGRLLAHPISGFAGFVLCTGWLIVARRRLLLDLWRFPKKGVPFGWWTHVWPLQWRVSISWLSTMAVMHGLNPATLFWKGAQEAGRVGLSMYILLTIHTMGWGWIATRIPVFGNLAAQKRWNELMHVFRGVVWRSTLFILILGGLLTFASAAIYHSGDTIPGIAQWIKENGLAPPSLDPPQTELPNAPILSPLPWALLVLAVASLHLFLARAALIRAHGHDALLPVALALAISVCGALVVVGDYGSTETMIAAYALCIMVVTLGLGTWVTRRALQEWHQS